MASGGKDGAEDGGRLSLFRSRLPRMEALAPYLREIDDNRRHANFGPLEQRLARALEDHFGTGPGTVALTANGSLALLHALKAAGAEPGGLAALPSWTYPATPAAASAAGLTPWFLDVDEATWAMEPGRVKRAMAEAPGRVAAVIVGAPFGTPAETAQWDAFADATGMPVVIDAANGFDSLVVGRVPTMVSLHATKAFGVGEGGFVASSDTALIERVRALANHGITGPGSAGLRGLNAKMSEIAAAVGLAQLDAWAPTRAGYASLKKAYRAALGDVPGLVPAPGDDADWVTSTINAVLPVDAGPVIAALDRQGIEARRWWGEACHRQPAYADCPSRDLLVTERLAARVLGLPFHLGMEAADAVRVARSLANALDETSAGRG